jgi:hypothetical protein
MSAELDSAQVDHSSHSTHQRFSNSFSRPDLYISQYCLLLTLGLESFVLPTGAFCALLRTICIISLAWLAFLSVLSPVEDPTTTDRAAEPSPPSTETTTTTRAESPMQLTCVICADTIPSAAVAVLCGHHFDIGCLTSLFQMATRDESVYPPQCCMVPIVFDQIKHRLPPPLVDLYEQKEIEYNTQKRVYCASPSCSRFLGSRDSQGLISTVRTCTSSGCTTRTCGRCTRKVYEGQRHICKTDKSERHAIAVGKSQGWVRCPGCEEMVERSYGCFHMTCRCRTQFCYICSALWKTCKCNRWTARFAAIRRQPMQAAIAVRKIFWTAPDPGMAKTLIRNTVCRHVDLSRRSVGRRCQNCEQPFVLGYRCSECQVVCCNDCKLKLSLVA